MSTEGPKDIHITWLSGLGASYRLKGYFRLSTTEDETLKIRFKGVAFGGLYGGHNVSIEISKRSKKNLRENVKLEDSSPVLFSVKELVMYTCESK